MSIGPSGNNGECTFTYNASSDNWTTDGDGCTNGTHCTPPFPSSGTMTTSEVSAHVSTYNAGLTITPLGPPQLIMPSSPIPDGTQVTVPCI